MDVVSFPAQGLVGLVGEGQSWLWFQGQTVSFTGPFSLLALVSGPKCVSFTGSGSRAKVI